MENSFKFENREIHYSIRGEGKVVILLHGYLESKEVWDSFADRLSDRFRVICIDLPGHGQSGIYGATHTMEFMATAVKALTDHLQIKKAFLAGHSLGGYVTLAFLELYPEVISGYCLFHSHPFSDTEVAIEKRLREIEVVNSGKKNLMYPYNIERMFSPDNLGKFPKALQRSKQLASVISAEGIVSVLNGMMKRPSRIKIMEQGTIPCMWILGAKDNYIPLDVITKVKLPSNAELVVLNNSGHLGFIEEEEESLRVLISFIEALK